MCDCSRLSNLQSTLSSVNELPGQRSHRGKVQAFQGRDGCKKSFRYAAHKGDMAVSEINVDLL